MSIRCTALAAAMLVAGTALAQATPATPATPIAAPKPVQKQESTVPTLSIGDKAPALAVAKWVKGEPITGFEKGKVYVVEFWATWCGPCVASMPHLTEIQKEYKDKGVTVIGVTSVDPNNTLEKVEKMVKDKGDEGMGYTVAWDTDRKTNVAFMEAARQNGIPCSYVVNQDGIIAYIGHPMGLDKPLAEIVAGKYDIKSAAEGFKASKAAEQVQTDFMMAMRKKDMAKASEIATKAIEGPWKNDPQMLNMVAWSIVNPAAKIEKRDTDLALKAAVRANEVTDKKDPAILDTLARVYFTKGETAKAIETQKAALGFATGDMKEELQKTLAEYEAAKK